MNRINRIIFSFIILSIFGFYMLSVCSAGEHDFHIEPNDETGFSFSGHGKYNVGDKVKREFSSDHTFNVIVKKVAGAEIVFEKYDVKYAKWISKIEKDEDYLAILENPHSYNISVHFKSDKTLELTDEESSILLIAIPVVALVVVIIIIATIIWLKYKEKTTTPSNDSQSNDQVYPQQHPCGTCGLQLSYVNEYQKWYCGYCKKYF